MALPAHIGSYTPTAVIYRNADVVLYTARAGDSDRRVVLKTVSPDAAAPNEANNSLMKEADLMQLCRHPNVARLLEHFMHDGHPVLVIEHIEGATLGDLVQKGPLSTTLWLSVMVDLLRAVSHLHEQQVVHLDIHLENIVVGTDRVARLIDFGAATGLGRDHTIRALNLRTSAPELHGEAVDQIGPSADIYSLGIVALVAALGEPAFRDELPHVYKAPPSTHHHRWYTLHADPHAILLPRLTQTNAGPLGALGELVALMVAADPDERPFPADDIADTIVGRLLGSDARGFSVPVPPKRKGRWAMVAAMSLMLCTVAGFALMSNETEAAQASGCILSDGIEQRLGVARQVPVEDYEPFKGVLEELLAGNCGADARHELGDWLARVKARDDLEPATRAALERWARTVQAHVDGI